MLKHQLSEVRCLKLLPKQQYRGGSKGNFGKYIPHLKGDSEIKRTATIKARNIVGLYFQRKDVGIFQHLQMKLTLFSKP